MTTEVESRAGRGRGTLGSPPRLLISASGDLWAGAAVQIHQVAKALVGRKRFLVRAALLNPGRLEDELRALGIEVEVLDERLRSNWWMVRRLFRLISEFGPDLVHVNDYKFQVLVTAACLTLPRRPALIRTYHSRPSRWPGLAGLKVAAFQRLDLLSLRHRTSRVITVSRDLERELASKLGSATIVTVPNGVPVDTAQPSDKGEVRERWGIPPHCVWIGTGIRLEDIKNPALLVEAAAILAESGARFVMSIFGEGRLEPQLRAGIAERGLDGKVVLHGHRDDLVEIMGAWDVFVLGSRHEGMPMVLLEAMSLGVPPVCTRVGGIAEIVEDGVSGALVAANDAPAMASALKALCDDREKREATGRAAARRVRERFSIEATVDRYCGIYGDVLAERREHASR